jgi:hypothetical protein
MEITVGIWVIPTFLTIGIWLWIFFGFDYSSGSYFPSFAPLITLPLGAFLTSFVWMIYFAVMYYTGDPDAT